jgi:hypothetical protein
MKYQSAPPPGKDPQLWQIAQRRASFKTSLSSYIVFSIFFWAIWFFTGASTYGTGIPWPVWPMFGWGIGLFFQYMKAYVQSNSNNIDAEYDKLTQSQNK